MRLFQALAWLVVAGLVVEFYLAGAALFGVTTFQPHRLLGVLLAAAMLLLLVVTVVARPGRRLLGQVALLLLLTLVQVSLPQLRSAVGSIAALHVVNAALLLGLAGPIARAAGRVPAGRSALESPQAVPSRP
jgi:hypothetical protein